MKAPNATSLSFRVSESGLPSHAEYESLVTEFNGRNLTFAQDEFHAFAGVSTLLARKFSGALISGIPETFFDLCLLWRPLRLKGAARRRLPLGSGAGAYLPSWSWMS